MLVSLHTNYSLHLARYLAQRFAQATAEQGALGCNSPPPPPLCTQVEDTSDVTIGGVMLPESAKERPLSGEIVTVGPGKYDFAEKKRATMKVGCLWC